MKTKNIPIVNKRASKVNREVQEQRSKLEFLSKRSIISAEVPAKKIEKK